MRGGKLLAARIVAAAGAVFWGLLFNGLQDTETVFTEGNDFAAHYVMESGWGLLFLLLVAVPLVALTFRPRSPVLIGEVAAVGLAVIAAAFLAGSAVHLLPGAGLLVTAVAVAAFAGVGSHQRSLHADRPLLILVLLATGPAFGYAWRMAHSTGDVEITAGLEHYPIQAALGIAVVLIAGVIAVTKDASRVRLAVATLTVTVIWIGIESVIYPHRLGSLGATWGWLAISWAVMFLVLASRPNPARSASPIDDTVGSTRRSSAAAE